MDNTTIAVIMPWLFILGLIVGYLIAFTSWKKSDQKRLNLEDYREFPCEDCQTGEMKHTGTSPGYRESTEHYTCDRCSAKSTFP